MSFQHKNLRSFEISDKMREFEELVTARGLEFRRKMEEKRETDVEIIKLRHFLTPSLFLEPFPTGAFTRLQNNQIWEMVLKYLTNSLDMHSTQNTCPTFQDIISILPSATPEEREVSAVLKILKKGLYSRAWDGGPRHVRQVSKSWERATDQAFLNKFQQDWHLELADGVWWKEYEMLIDSWRFFEDSISRALRLRVVCLTETCMNEMGKILEFLDEHGGHVKGLIVEWKESTISWANKYMNLLNLVMRMPNLKALRIDLAFHMDQPDVDTNEIKNLMSRHRFPPLSSLELLAFRDNYFWLLPEPLVLIVTEILSKCCKLKSISMRDFMLENESVSRCLEGRQIEFIDCHDNLSEKTWLSLAHFPLRKIILLNPGYKYKTCSDFSSSLNLFGKTLEYLEVPRISPEFREGSVALQLPKLKKLILPLCAGVMNFDFLIPLSGLEHLELIFNESFVNYKNCKGENFCLLEIKEFDELEKSNVWTVFPKLRYVTVIVHEKFYDMRYDKYNGEWIDDYEYKCQTTYKYFKRGKEITKDLKFKTTPDWEWD